MNCHEGHDGTILDDGLDGGRLGRMDGPGRRWRRESIWCRWATQAIPASGLQADVPRVDVRRASATPTRSAMFEVTLALYTEFLNAVGGNGHLRTLPRDMDGLMSDRSSATGPKAITRNRDVGLGQPAREPGQLGRCGPVRQLADQRQPSGFQTASTTDGWHLCTQGAMTTRNSWR